MKNFTHFQHSVAALIVLWIAGSPIPAAVQANPQSESLKNVIRFEGKTFEQVLTEFQSELSPATRITSLEILIQFAIRGHHADEVAELLINEARILPMSALIEVDPHDPEGMLHQVMADFDAYTVADTDLDADVEQKLKEEMQYWSKVCEGIYRLALPQRNVFEHAIENPEHPLPAQILARIAVQHADLRTVKIKEFLKSFPQKSAASTMDIRPGDIVTVTIPAHGKDNQTGREFEAEADIHATVVNILDDKTLCLEYRKSSQTGQIRTTIHMTGRVRAEDVGAERRVHAEKVSELVINQQHKNLE